MSEKVRVKCVRVKYKYDMLYVTCDTDNMPFEETSMEEIINSIKRSPDDFSFWISDENFDNAINTVKNVMVSIVQEDIKELDKKILHIEETFNNLDEHKNKKFIRFKYDVSKSDSEEIYEEHELDLYSSSSQTKGYIGKAARGVIELTKKDVVNGYCRIEDLEEMKAKARRALVEALMNKIDTLENI